MGATKALQSICNFPQREIAAQRQKLEEIQCKRPFCQLQ